MDVTLSEVLRVYGPLGALAFVGCAATVYMFRTLSRERAAHKAEMQLMIDRYIETVKTFHTQYHGLAEKLHTLVESLDRKVDRRVQ